MLVNKNGIYYDQLVTFYYENRSAAIGALEYYEIVLLKGKELFSKDSTATQEEKDEWLAEVARLETLN
jgi:hypothetical protein